MRQYKSIALALGGIIGIPLFVVVFSQQFIVRAAEAPCHGMTASSAVPEGYGAPYDTLASSKPLLLRVICDPSSSPRFEVGTGESNQYAYHIGYHYQNGAWRQLRLGGPKEVAGLWWEGSAEIYIPPIFEAGETQYLVAYVCTYTGNTWKCGCRDRSCATNYWQLQTLTLSETQSGGALLPNPLSVLEGYDELLLAYPSTPVSTPGQVITLFGSKFSLSSNTVHFGNTKVTNVAAQTENSLRVTVPNAPYGVTEVRIQNEHGTSNPTVFVVKNPDTPSPIVTSISPASAPYGTEITILGTGFSANNTIFGMGDLFEAVSNDGTTIRFRVRPFPDVPELQTGNYPNQDLTIPIFFRVMNENGIVAEPKEFVLTL